MGPVDSPFGRVLSSQRPNKESGGSPPRLEVLGEEVSLPRPLFYSLFSHGYRYPGQDTRSVYSSVSTRVKDLLVSINT